MLILYLKTLHVLFCAFDDKILTPITYIISKIQIIYFERAIGHVIERFKI